jgi:hypothetical protein
MGWLDKLRHSLGISSSQTDEESQPRSIKVSEIQASSDWGGFASDDRIEGLEFRATLQLRTPLRILTKHGEIHKDRESPPPSYAKEEWGGIWIPKTDYRSDFLSEGATVSSDIGYVPSGGGNLLPFLIAVREIVETELLIDQRRKKLFGLLKNNEWSEIVSLYGGDVQIVDRLFPPFLKTIGGLSKDSIAELYQANLRTPESLEKSSDKDLLKVKGIGPSKLKKIRKICSTTTDKYCEWTDVPK